jgi:hypothetical protein
MSKSYIVFTYDKSEIAIDPTHIVAVLERTEKRYNPSKPVTEQLLDRQVCNIYLDAGANFTVEGTISEVMARL